MAERRVLLGGRKLRTYLTRIEQSVPAFCEEHGLDRIQVQRFMSGERWQRVSVDFAFDIEKATKGTISWKDWRSCTAIAVPEDTHRRTGTDGS